MSVAYTYSQANFQQKNREESGNLKDGSLRTVRKDGLFEEKYKNIITCSGGGE